MWLIILLPDICFPDAMELNREDESQLRCRCVHWCVRRSHRISNSNQDTRSSSIPYYDAPPLWHRKVDFSLHIVFTLLDWCIHSALAADPPMQRNLKNRPQLNHSLSSIWLGWMSTEIWHILHLILRCYCFLVVTRALYDLTFNTCSIWYLAVSIHWG